MKISHQLRVRPPLFLRSLFFPNPHAKKEENIYLGLHGAPPSQPKQQELNSSNWKQRFKQKLK